MASIGASITEFAIGDGEAPLFETDHIGPASADRSEGSEGHFNKKHYCLDGWACWVDVLYA